MNTVVIDSFPTQQLSAADRCDVCGARAYMKVVLQNGELYFCSHHGKKNQSALEKIAISIVDESAYIK